MDMQKHVATKIALTVLEKVKASDHWQDINLEIDWQELNRLIPEPNMDELDAYLKDSESFNRMLDKLNEEVDAEIKRLESSLIN
ncbi:hypothetical protein J520_3047 [Acinetobacter sp. 869535]|uniref:hypothetical protein n=1 Tax=Acinetobacter sp. 869535 TaxID=1310621 RepID=UPI0004499B5D|nr:hypothetical protein [Acinetobacter sp. 869535]EXC25578.1 hypothetical protein J520_3047 [Acinetobacter sp. 869535]